MARRVVTAARNLQHVTEQFHSVSASVVLDELALHSESRAKYIAA